MKLDRDSESRNIYMYIRNKMNLYDRELIDNDNNFHLPVKIWNRRVHFDSINFTKPVNDSENQSNQ